MAEKIKIQIVSSGVVIRNNEGEIVQTFPTEKEAWEYLHEHLDLEEKKND